MFINEVNTIILSTKECWLLNMCSELDQNTSEYKYLQPLLCCIVLY